MFDTIKDKIAICYVACGPTYRESAYRQLKEYYSDHDNVYYCVLTDDKSYFDSIKRKNLVVNELKDFYSQFPNIEKNEFFLESSSKTDYSTKFVSQKYLFPFSTYRFCLLQCLKLSIKNVALLCTDTVIDVSYIYDSYYESNLLFNAVSEWDEDFDCYKMQLVSERLTSKYGYEIDKKIRVLDAAGRMYFADSLESLKKLFDLWQDTIEYLYETKEINRYRGHYVIHDEHILAPIYNALGLNNKRDYHGSRMFVVKHNQLQERYWRLGGSGEIKEHHDYEEFLKINNLTDHA